MCVKYYLLSISNEKETKSYHGLNFVVTVEGN